MARCSSSLYVLAGSRKSLLERVRIQYFISGFVGYRLQPMTRPQAVPPEHLIPVRIRYEVRGHVPEFVYPGHLADLKRFKIRRYHFIFGHRRGIRWRPGSYYGPWPPEDSCRLHSENVCNRLAPANPPGFS